MVLFTNTLAEASLVKKEPITQQSYIALLFHKMTGQEMDFDALVRDTTAYRSAKPKDKGRVFKEKRRSLKEFFSLMRVDDPLYVDLGVQLSKYSNSYHGYFIKGFDNGDVFFTYNFLGEDYAIIPKKIENQQWLKISPEKSVDVESHTHTDKRILDLRMVLKPVFADSKSKFNIQGKDYWLIMADIENVQIWNYQGRELIWEKGMVFSGKTKELMHFYQKD